ncbi:hypothetical protein L3X38_032883 [Prunus dulcis]|uniref:Uncharacterized protein n=1 Tax=Prunus dulcis TaxID=3755 RepID=A0AAD4VEY5_PRUDU|nr:hypothetical protein L3X38_032883 [Prunus dulcis]
MSLTRDAVLFESTVRGPISEVGAQRCGLPDLPSTQLLFNCFRHPSDVTPRSSSPINRVPERNENEKGAGPTPLPELLGVLFVFNCR